MAQLVGLIVSEDDSFKKPLGRLLRAGAVPVSVLDDGAPRDGVQPDLMVVDIRGDALSALSQIERLRAGAPSASIFAVAMTAVRAMPYVLAAPPGVVTAPVFGAYRWPT